jgi:hypothetical protein
MMATTPADSRIDWVDYAKGICIILVVMMHSTLGVAAATGEPNWLLGFIEWARPFRMPTSSCSRGCSWPAASTGPGAPMPIPRSCTSPTSTCSG